MMERAHTREMQKSSTPARTNILQRKCSLCPKKKKLVQRSSLGGAEVVPSIVYEALRSPGQPLDAATRAFFEPKLGHDFSRVRVYNNAKAAELAKSVDARALTLGENIVFGAGNYAPGTGNDRRLLAHELTHVVQQRDSWPIHPEELRISQQSDPAEIEADNATESIMKGQPFNPTLNLSSKIYRDAPVGSIAATESAPIPEAELFQTLHTFPQMWRTFEEHQNNGRDSEALEMVPSLLGRMMTDDALNHAGDLAVWLIGLNQWEMARRALHELESAWYIRFVDEYGPGVPIATFGAFGDFGPEDLMEQAENQDTSGEHQSARELFGLAFLFLQMQLIAASDRRLAVLDRLRGMDELAISSFSLFRLMSYSGEGQIISKMRQIIGFYAIRERESLASGQMDLAQSFNERNRQLRQYLIEHSLLTGSGEGSRAVVMEATVSNRPERGRGFVLHGAQGVEEFVTPLPGTPRPDELDRHEVYTASMEDLLEDIGGQEDFINEIYRYSEVRDAFRGRSINMNDLGTRMRVWQLMFSAYQRQPAEGCNTALCSLLHLMERYLHRFTAHSEYNIRDFGVSYLDSRFPEDLLGRTMQDCGVYAVTVAYEVYRTVHNATPRMPVGFQLYHTLEHVLLVIFDQTENNHYVVNNDQIVGPRSGDASGTIAQTYGELMGRTQLLSAAGRSSMITSQLNDATFRNLIWQGFRSGTHLSLDTEPQSGPADTRTEQERRQDTYRQYYQAMERFDRIAGETHILLDRLNQTLSAIPDRANHITAMSSVMTHLTQLGIRQAVIFDTYRNPQVVGLQQGATLSVERMILMTSGRNLADHPLVRLGKALMYYESIGNSLSQDQQALLSWIRAAPMPSFGSSLSAYQNAGRPLPF